jgi:hypothetical protein
VCSASSAWQYRTVDALEIERLIGEVAKRHHLLLSRDDPLLISVTLHELLLDRHLARLELALETAQRQIAATAVQQTDLARDNAAKLITAAAGYADEEIRAAARHAAAEIAGALKTQLAPFRPTASVVTSNQCQTMLWGLLASAVGVLIAAGILYLLWGQPVACKTPVPRAANQARTQQR